MRRRLTPIIRAMLVAGLAGCAWAGEVLATQPRVAPQDWHDAKCARYKVAWTHALGRMGPQGLGRDFLDRHAAFLASNCTRRSDVCQRSEEELRLANIMVVMSMNFGAASTFVPFACR